VQAARVAVALFSAALCVGAEDLLQEFNRRSATEGLALIHWNGVPVDVLTFDAAPQATWRFPFLVSKDIPRTSLRSAWFSSTGDVVVWAYGDHAEPSSCRNPLIVISPTAPWQIPGSIRGIQALGVSTDGSRVAFDGVYKPPGTASPSRENQAR
jgi:hypothetical protein